MTAMLLAADERRTWSTAGAVALAVHVAFAALVLAWARPAEPPVPEPVVLVELPPQAPAAAAAAQPQAAPNPQPDAAPQHQVTPPIELPPALVPLPSNAVTLPPPPQMARPATAAPAVSAAAPAPVAPAVNGTGAVAGNDPRARQQEASYFALVSAHLNRRKIYPAEARQARQQGVVTVRFTVDRAGGVSGVSIKRSSGHELLDRATLDLLQRVAPLPRMPASMLRDSVTLSLPIDYSLRTI